MGNSQNYSQSQGDQDREGNHQKNHNNGSQFQRFNFNQLNKNDIFIEPAQKPIKQSVGQKNKEQSIYDVIDCQQQKNKQYDDDNKKLQILKRKKSDKRQNININKSIQDKVQSLALKQKNNWDRNQISQFGGGYDNLKQLRDLAYRQKIRNHVRQINEYNESAEQKQKQFRKYMQQLQNKHIDNIRQDCNKNLIECFGNRIDKIILLYIKQHQALENQSQQFRQYIISHNKQQFKPKTLSSLFIFLINKQIQMFHFYQLDQLLTSQKLNIQIDKQAICHKKSIQLPKFPITKLYLAQYYNCFIPSILKIVQYVIYNQQESTQTNKISQPKYRSKQELKQMKQKVYKHIPKVKKIWKYQKYIPKVKQTQKQENKQMKQQRNELLDQNMEMNI